MNDKPDHGFDAREATPEGGLYDLEVLPCQSMATVCQERMLKSEADVLGAC